MLRWLELAVWPVVLWIVFWGDHNPIKLSLVTLAGIAWYVLRDLLRKKDLKVNDKLRKARSEPGFALHVILFGSLIVMAFAGFAFIVGLVVYATGRPLSSSLAFGGLMVLPRFVQFACRLTIEFVK